ncbi:MAG: polyprenol monophosphomannose synthase [Chloroflexi bacterium]|nr:polyprenol monophosphomannose synthase [Chloroflexota bacterium]
MKIITILPTYNEAENLPQIVRELLDLDGLDLHILIVDDNSPDGTGAIADALHAACPARVEVLHRPGKQGLGKAYLAGFRVALAQGADRIIQMDADFSHNPRYVPEIVQRSLKYDVVIGSRYTPGGSVDDRWGPGRRFLSWGGNVYARLVTSLKVQDATAGFKCFRREVLQALDLDAVRSDGYAFQIEMNYLCQRQGFSFCEVPIFFEDRRIGSSKMTLPIVMEAAWRVWEVRFWR